MENISKLIFSIEDGKRVGYVLDVAIDFESLQKVGYFVVDEENESEFLLDLKDVTSASGDFLLVENFAKLQFVANRNSIFGKSVLDEQGNFFGNVQAVTFWKNRCKKIVTNRCEILAKYVKFVGVDAIFVGFGRKRKTGNGKSAKIFADKTFVARKSDGLENLVKIQESKKAEIERVLLSPAYYVGKICTKDIFGYNNEKIAGKGQVVTKLVVEKAKRHNRLNQLFFALSREN